ncbi:tRNA (adenosine(37)-N6)-dimethylallyltransferase MiaA [Papillibacter cinnamivorans]|uniref:tRNA dimethylallyltransferase n=1 Tax=Papillibacter cinnamivorans DSM 12816 TaxID=1122930 RepID=A0A1W2A6B4_9FIRM|nr:tRNA (adenosine(37)-N6)-dimethylallyltransferase MiaA [Papillibacter cinnamivorans]SMC55951.1 tRNA dimethylallyltransferase [Papillibacter cinnamivorans DSM 12816]
MKHRIVCVVGPTATGKTALGVELALALDGEIVSADSMQVYRGMDIGTAKPGEAERKGVPHHMLDVVGPEEEYSAARYVRDASSCVDDILARGKLPIVVGGTGLYAEALVSGRDFAPAGTQTACREELQKQLEREGPEAMLELLRRFDPDSAARLHRNDSKRILRALEVWYVSGKTISQHNEETRRAPPRYEAFWIGLNYLNRQDLYDRIDSRVDRMLAAGLLEEVRALLAGGVPKNGTALQAIGYKELVNVVQGTADLASAVDKIKMESRRYAKRQLTWFRKNPEIHWISWDKTPDLELARQISWNYLKNWV